MKISENIFRNLSDDQKRQLESNPSPEEVLRLVKETGIELTPDQLESIPGGGWGSNKGNIRCPKCKSTNVSGGAVGSGVLYHCKDCGNVFGI